MTCAVRDLAADMLSFDHMKSAGHKKIFTTLDRLYPNVTCALHYDGPFQLLVATILSAQCTDKRVNIVTPGLFSKFGTVKKMADARVSDIEKLIRSTGFYHSKARHISDSAKMIMEKFNSEVPRTMKELTMLPGVARKTANVVLSVGFGLHEGVVVDTHVGRLSRRLGLTFEKTPEKIEKDLMKLVERNKWDTFSLQLIQHGRLVCIARRPRCDNCALNTLCPSAGTFGRLAARRGGVPASKKIS